MQNENQVYRFNSELKSALPEEVSSPSRPGESFTVEAGTPSLHVLCQGNVVRPTLYIASDDYSHLVLGGLVSLEAANPITAKLALLSSFEDKPDPNRWPHNIKHDNDWPKAVSLPQKVTGDFGQENTKLCQELRVEVVKNQKAYRPDMPSVCEIVLGKFQSALPPFGMLMDKDSRQDVHPQAMHPDVKFVESIFAHIANCHNQETRRRLPDSAWFWTNVPGNLGNGARVHSPDLLRSLLLPRAQKARWIPRVGLQVSADGIRGVFYHPLQALLPKLLLSTKADLGAHFDPRSMNQVWVRIAKHHTLVEFTLAPRSQQYSGMSWAEARLTNQRVKQRLELWDQGEHRKSQRGTTD